jgi:hypothetical protein
LVYEVLQAAAQLVLRGKVVQLDQQDQKVILAIPEGPVLLDLRVFRVLLHLWVQQVRLEVKGLPAVQVLQVVQVPQVAVLQVLQVQKVQLADRVQLDSRVFPE